MKDKKLLNIVVGPYQSGHYAVSHPEAPPPVVISLPEGGLLATGDELMTIFTLARMEPCERAERLFEGLSDNAKNYVRKNKEYFSCLEGLI